MPWNKGWALPCFQLGWSSPVAAKFGRAVTAGGRPPIFGRKEMDPGTAAAAFRAGSPHPALRPVAAGGGEHRAQLQTPQGKDGRKEVPWAGLIPRRDPAPPASSLEAPSRPLPGGWGHLWGIALGSVSCSRQGSGDPAGIASGRAPGADPPGRLRLEPLRPRAREGQRFGLFLGIEFGHSQRVCVPGAPQRAAVWKWCPHTDGTASAAAGVPPVGASASSLAQYLVLAVFIFICRPFSHCLYFLLFTRS